MKDDQRVVSSLEKVIKVIIIYNYKHSIATSAKQVAQLAKIATAAATPIPAVGPAEAIAIVAVAAAQPAIIVHYMITRQNAARIARNAV